jgi:prepilin-type N-terminal cleavage/methylation domain-containing protein
MTGAHGTARAVVARRRRGRGRATARRGFTLVEVLVALSLLVVAVLGMAMASTKAARGVSNTGARSRAQAMADRQIALARGWNNYATLSDLAGASYNVAVDGLTPVTQVTVNTSGGLRYTTVDVKVSGSATSGLPVPVVRQLIIAAP